MGVRACARVCVQQHSGREGWEIETQAAQAHGDGGCCMRPRAAPPCPLPSPARSRVRRHVRHQLLVPQRVAGASLPHRCRAQRLLHSCGKEGVGGGGGGAATRAHPPARPPVLTPTRAAPSAIASSTLACSSNSSSSGVGGCRPRGAAQHTRIASRCSPRTKRGSTPASSWPRVRPPSPTVSVAIARCRWGCAGWFGSARAPASSELSVRPPRARCLPLPAPSLRSHPAPPPHTLRDGKGRAPSAAPSEQGG